MKRRFLVLAAILLALAALLMTTGSAASSKAKWPESTSKGQKTNGKLKVDISHTDQGYFMAAVSSKSKHKMKLRVTFKGETLTYDLDTSGSFEVFPFQLGSGSYEVSLWENVSGKKYSSAGKITLKVKLEKENIAFLYPNQYVNYTKSSAVVAQADKLCKGKNEKEIYEAVRKFMTSTFVYDFVKAATIKPGMLPDIDGSYKKKMGVCQDLSAIMVCMLRTQGIPARLIIGYADKNYHAWTVTEIGGKEIFFDPTAALNAISKPASYTVERYY